MHVSKYRLKVQTRHASRDDHDGERAFIRNVRESKGRLLRLTRMG